MAVLKGMEGQLFKKRKDTQKRHLTAFKAVVWVLYWQGEKHRLGEEGWGGDLINEYVL